MTGLQVPAHRTRPVPILGLWTLSVYDQTRWQQSLVLHLISA
jgi:hypothetical protein